MKHTTIRHALVTVAASLLFAGAAQAAQLDNREIGHTVQIGSSSLIYATGGLDSREVGHFALQAPGSANDTAGSGGVISGSEFLTR